MELPRDFCPPDFYGSPSYLRSFENFGRKISTTGTCPPTSSSSSSTLQLVCGFSSFWRGRATLSAWTFNGLGPNGRGLVQNSSRTHEPQDGPSSQPSSAFPMKISSVVKVLQLSCKASEKQFPSLPLRLLWGPTVTGLNYNSVDVKKKHNFSPFSENY